MAMTLNDFKSPKHKVFTILRTGRAKWKAKHHEVKKRLRLKLAGNQIRAVTKSRENWRNRALEFEPATPFPTSCSRKKSVWPCVRIACLELL